ncbi:MAG: M14 family metallopeptidase [Myxococcota bacterium]
MATAAQAGTVVVYGRSVEGRDLVAIELPGDGPEVWVTAGIHGIEFIGVATALAILAAGPLPGARLVVCPVLNPDAYAATEGGARRRVNARGVDLNRNFPLPYGARPSRWSALGAGSNRPGDHTYRGPNPRSEPETDALAALIEARRPHASANLHSAFGTLFCARVWHPSDWQGYRALTRAFRAGQPGPRRYCRVGTPVFDVFTGELEDWQHHVMQCWAVCVECFGWWEAWAQRRETDPFWRFNPRDPAPIAARDAAAVRAMLGASAALPRPPLRPGASDARPGW